MTTEQGLEWVKTYLDPVEQGACLVFRFDVFWFHKARLIRLDWYITTGVMICDLNKSIMSTNWMNIEAGFRMSPSYWKYVGQMACLVFRSKIYTSFKIFILIWLTWRRDKSWLTVKNIFMSFQFFILFT